MARASKVRFVAKVSGGFRELLSVTERKDGSLIVVPKGAAERTRVVTTSSSGTSKIRSIPSMQP